MILIIYIIFLLGGIGIGGLIFSEFNCKHDWELIESGKITNTYGHIKRYVGWIKVYECSKCKKMKKEQIDIRE